MSVKNTRFTPARRGPSLGDGAGGTSERPAARERDPVLRDVGHKTEDIRLIPAGTDVSAGNGVFYDVGKVDQLSVGRYRVTRQTAASATAEPLSDYAFCDFDIIESTAGVFTAVVTSITTTDGATLQEDATITAVADAALDGAGSDSRATIFVATSADVTDAAAWTAAATLTQGNLYILDAEEADDHVFTITRMT